MVAMGLFRSCASRLSLVEAQVHGNVASKALFLHVMFAWLFFLLKSVRWVPQRRYAQRERRMLTLLV